MWSKAESRPFRFPASPQADLQPPLPLQLFLPLQPMSPALQPPWPLQLFMPLQSCLDDEAVEEAALPESLLQPVMRVVAPATNPAMAAERMSVLAFNFIIVSELFVCFDLLFIPHGHRPRRAN